MTLNPDVMARVTRTVQTWPDADMGAWTTFVATHDYDDLNDAYAAWSASRSG